MMPTRVARSMKMNCATVSTTHCRVLILVDPVDLEGQVVLVVQAALEADAVLVDRADRAAALEDPAEVDLAPLRHR